MPCEIKNKFKFCLARSRFCLACAFFRQVVRTSIDGTKIFRNNKNLFPIYSNSNIVDTNSIKGQVSYFIEAISGNKLKPRTKEFKVQEELQFGIPTPKRNTLLFSTSNGGTTAQIE